MSSSSATLSSSSYTAKLANNRRHNRTTISFSLINILPHVIQPQVDKYVLGPLSIITFFIILNILVLTSLLLVPGIIYSKYMGWPSMFNKNSKKKDVNISIDIGSVMAVKTLFARSQTYLQNCGGPDSLAPQLMKQLSILGPNIPGSILYTSFYGILSRMNFYLVGRVFAEQLSELFLSNVLKFGVEVGLLQPRACWLDDVVDTFVMENEDKQCNVVILGAGYDSRCYRLDSLKNNSGKVRLYEIDAAGSQRSKKDVLYNAKIDSSNVQFIECDFETQDWMETLCNTSDFDKSLPTLFVWEGVSYYLNIEVVIDTVAKVSECGKGSYIGFDYYDLQVLNATMTKSSDDMGEKLKSGIADVSMFINDCNEQALSAVAAPEELQVKDHLRCNELKRRYIAHCNGGRSIGYLTEFGGFLLLGSSKE